MSQPHQVTCAPPLGQTTVFDEAVGARFTVLLRWNVPPIQRDWEVAVWHNFNDERWWTESRLECVEANTRPVTGPNNALCYPS